MKLSKLYSNKPAIFHPIFFKDGVNVILGEIQTTKQKNTHNLGKSLLAQLIDFCLGKTLGKDSFLKLEQFCDYQFFLEIELSESHFVTIGKNTLNPSKFSLKYHSSANQDFRGLLNQEWDHFNLDKNTGIELIDSLLNLNFIKGYSYRKIIGYLLRSQSDYLDPFQLSKNNRSKDSHWKPILAKLLGFDDQLINKLYNIQNQLSELNTKNTKLINEKGIASKSISDIEGEIKTIELKILSIENDLTSLDFGKADKERITHLVDCINHDIVELNNHILHLKSNISRIQKSLNTQTIIFSPDDAQELFNEAGILFSNQIKKDFEDLIRFHKSIGAERKIYLEQELLELTEELKLEQETLLDLNSQKSKHLKFLNDTSVLDKYRELNNEFVELKAKLLILQNEKESIYHSEKLKKEINNLKTKFTNLETKIKENVHKTVANNDSTFSKIRNYFIEIIDRTLSKNAFISVSVNTKGNLEFSTRFLESEAHRGHSYQRLLCIAFDMAIARVYAEQGYPLFLYHDGVFESLDDRIKENLLNIIREYSKYGIQHILTLIDSEIPKGHKRNFIHDDELILRLHDKDQSGRLFKMDEW